MARWPCRGPSEANASRASARRWSADHDGRGLRRRPPRGGPSPLVVPGAPASAAGRAPRGAPAPSAAAARARLWKRQRHARARRVRRRGGHGARRALDRGRPRGWARRPARNDPGRSRRCRGLGRRRAPPRRARAPRRRGRRAGAGAAGAHRRRDAHHHRSGLRLALERSRSRARPSAALQRQAAPPSRRARGVCRDTRDVLQYAAVSRLCAGPVAQARPWRAGARSSAAAARAQCDARMVLCSRALPRSTSPASGRILAALDRASMTPARTRGWEWAVVGAVWLVVVAVVGAWLAIDRHPPEWDYANHLERAVLCWRGVASGDVRAVLGRSSFYPPLVPCLAGLGFRVMPSDAAFGQIVILAFLGIGMAATYLLARRWASGMGAVVAAILVGTAPFIMQLTLRFQLDVPLMAMVAVALETLLRTEGFRRLGWSLIVGLVLGLGLLTKPPFAAYVAPVLVLTLITVRHVDAGRNALAAMVVTLILAVPWYGPRILGIPMQVQSRS